MRLLHTTSFRFQEFFDTKVPPYAILSHRWEEEKEVSFQEFEVGKKQAWPGFLKIEKCCSLAKSRGFDWVWIDTCCIDKKSSAELSEAINSRFRWYAEAGECYAYLSDVRWNKRVDFEASFKQSAWFTRGWTLQELLAPSNVIFFDFKWHRIGYKKKLLREISDATGIGVQYLNDMHKASVATKMSWISRRQTSRVEDMAYCLLGLFDVNLPLLYGEGRKAFLRLELEIVKKSDDESIFAWTSTKANGHSGLLALWPDAFADSADVRAPDSNSSNNYVTQLGVLGRRPYAMTNKGLEFPAPLRGLPTLLLNCWKNSGDVQFPITIRLRKHGSSWQRTDCGELHLSKLWDVSVPIMNATEIQTIYIKQDGL